MNAPANQPLQPAGFDGLNVAAFESRRAREIGRLIEKHGGVAHVSPSMQEVPLEKNKPAVDFAYRLITGEIDIVIFLTGVGFRYLLETVSRNLETSSYLHALEDITTVARGPKPVAAMREAGIEPTIRADEPNTWREILTALDQQTSLANQTVGLQEYGTTNPSLVAGLEARGATVISVPVYRWKLPDDQKPLENNLQAIVNGEREVLLFTSAHQVTNVLTVCQQLGLEKEFQQQLPQLVVASIGPTTSEALRQHHFPVDLEPNHPKMGGLVSAAAKRCHPILERKQVASAMLSGPTSDPADTQAPWYQSPFMKACRQEACDVTPVWLMRQAGRYMKEYRDVREQTTFLELCKNPSLCSEVMLTAVEKLGVDAAIIFSDLLPILEPMGLELEYQAGEGPVIHNPVRDASDVDRILELEDVSPLNFVMETVRQTRQDLAEDLPLIGFSGAPFTLLSYVIEGGSSRNYLHTKKLMYRDPGAWRTLMERFQRAVTRYLNAQIDAGVQCVQLFDSWAGALSPQDYRHYVLPYVQRIIQDLPPTVPVINFATGNPALLPLLAETDCAVVGVDWRIGLADAWQDIGHQKAVQGNLDPTILLSDLDEIRRQVQFVLDQAEKRPGHIFNLGHGVLPETPVEHAMAVVELVHELSQD
ncbi:MAG TPA: uroporphyrinogen decarboxylase [Planctomycetaceae bacterium]|nr:uroporphyrinogen decarboxylase [Planctomycetaceae bacterium]